MKGLTGVGLAVAVLLFGWESLLAGQICVHVYNISALRPAAVERSVTRAAAMYRELGIEMSWLMPPPQTPEAHVLDFSFIRISAAERSNRACLVARFAEGAASQKRSRALGMALIDSREGIDFEIYPDNLRFLENPGGVTKEALLAYVFVHESAHVLLHEAHHSGSGMMRATWGRRELWEISVGAFNFTREEDVRLRAAVSMFCPQQMARSPAVAHH